VTRSALPPEVHAVLEIVIDGLSIEAVARAMRAGILAACRPGIVAISAGNYGGTLGPYHLRLREVLA
jgi:formylmethanofuran--tetrahydromethanopterin N-formyltransferase